MEMLKLIHLYASLNTNKNVSWHFMLLFMFVLPMSLFELDLLLCERAYNILSTRLCI